MASFTTPSSRPGLNMKFPLVWATYTDSTRSHAIRLQRIAKHLPVLPAPDSEREKLHVSGTEGSTRSRNASTSLSEARAQCGNSARWDLRGGRSVMVVPTATRVDPTPCNSGQDRSPVKTVLSKPPRKFEARRQKEPVTSGRIKFLRTTGRAKRHG